MDQQQRREIEARLDTFGRDAEEVAANARSALDRLRSDDVQSACDLAGLSHYPISRVRADQDALMEMFTGAEVEAGARR